jgi:hypothetical protein
MCGRMGGMSTERRLRLLANTTLVYPLLAVGALTVCWLLAHDMLGHAPVVYRDDPEETFRHGGVGLLYPVATWLLIVPIVPVFIASVSLNVVYVLEHKPSAAQAGLRAFTTASIWLWLWVWVRTDPPEIIKWWMD